MMVNACVYDPSTGEILRAVSCPADIVALQAGPGEAVIEGAADDSSHCVVAGALVAYSPEERARKAARPRRAAQWSNAAREWVDQRTLAQRKAERWEQIKLARTAAIDAPLPTPYGTFDADPASRQNITDAVMMVQTLDQLGEPSSIDFTLADNSVVTLTASEMVDVGLRLGAQVQAAHATSRALRAQIDAATTAEEVDAVAWP